MFGLFGALKAPSFFNLKFYRLILVQTVGELADSLYRKKYRKVKICPIVSYGGSTGEPPTQVRINVVVSRNQKVDCVGG